MYVLVGSWLLIAPYLFGYADTMLATSDQWIGFTLGVIGFIQLFTNGRALWINWVALMIGLWLMISPFILSLSNPSLQWNDILISVIVVRVAVRLLEAASTQTSRYKAYDF